MVAVVLAFAGLLGRSRWGSDEYITLTWIIRLGWMFLVHWYVTWSPRLWSDLLYAAYGALVHLLHRPLAGSCMAVLWVGLAVACVLPALWSHHGHALRRVFVGLSILALCLVGHGVTEVFFWPAGGLSYIPTLAGVVWLFWHSADGIVGARRFGAAAALALAAGSSEVGIFFALAFCACALVWGWRRPASLWWMLPGLGLAAVDLVLVLQGRVATIEMANPGNSYLHHALASLVGALPRFWSQLVSGGPTAEPYASDLVRVGARVLVLLAARWCLWPIVRLRGPDSATLLVTFATACVVTIFLSLVAMLYQFGVPCCERHDTMRECLLMLACVGLGAWSATKWAPSTHWTGVSPIVLAVCLLGARQAIWLRGDYALYPASLSARARTWRSGLADGPSMVLVAMPSGAIVTGDGFSPGVSDLSATTPWPKLGIMQFFGKTNLRVVTP